MNGFFLTATPKKLVGLISVVVLLLILFSPFLIEQNRSFLLQRLRKHQNLALNTTHQQIIQTHKNTHEQFIQTDNTSQKILQKAHNTHQQILHKLNYTNEQFIHKLNKTNQQILQKLQKFENTHQQILQKLNKTNQQFLHKLNNTNEQLLQKFKNTHQQFLQTPNTTQQQFLQGPNTTKFIQINNNKKNQQFPYNMKNQQFPYNTTNQQFLNNTNQQFPYNTTDQQFLHELNNTHQQFLQKLNNNSVFRFYNLTVPKRRPHYDLVVVISSAPGNVALRDAIRETWLHQCKNTDTASVYCIFATDKLSPSNPLNTSLMEEQEIHQDLHFQVSMSPMDFGGRLLYQMYWAYLSFDFNYFLHMDDDYFVCLQHLMAELPLPAVSLQYGYVHCEKNVVRIDEGFVVMSHDIINTVVTWDPESMECHNFGGQQIGLWNEKMQIEVPYSSDERLHHSPIAISVSKFETLENVCRAYIGVHGVSGELMRGLWKRRGTIDVTAGHDLTYYTKRQCGDKKSGNFIEKRYHWIHFSVKWAKKPVLCKLHSTFGSSDKSYEGGVQEAARKEKNGK